MKIYLDQTVYDAALERMRWVFEEFPNVVVSFSGGKDSTVIFRLALQVAREMNRLPLRVQFLDQEAEWNATIEAVREVMSHPNVEPYWMQFPFKLFNATSVDEHWLNCWAPDKENFWMRPKEPGAYVENNFGTDRFGKLFTAMPRVLWPGVRTAFLAGVRCEESPSRSVGLTHTKKYKWVSWASSLSDGNYTFYPIYDWSTSDVWKAINDNKWPYCSLYDHMYRYGVPSTKMRVSNVHHETAVWALFVIQEIEPETYQRLCARIAGIDMAGKMGLDDYFPKVLPPMFGSWREYRDYLLEKLITNPEWNASMTAQFAKHEDVFLARDGDKIFRSHITSILCNDWEGIKLAHAYNRGPNIGLVKEARARRKQAKLAEDLL